MFPITLRNPYVAARPPNTERFRRRSHGSWKKQCTVAASHLEVSTAAPKNRSPDVALPIRCRAGGLTMSLMALAAVSEPRQDFRIFLSIM
jgi:hypothetical protein